MNHKEPRISDDLSALLAELQAPNGVAEHYLQGINCILRRLILTMDDYTPVHQDYLNTEGSMALLVGLHDVVSLLAYPDGDRFEQLFDRDCKK